MKILSLIRRRPKILKQDCLIILALIAAGVIVYANSFSNSFVWDDELLITANHSITSLRSAARFFTAELAPKIGGNFFRPLQSLSYAIDYHFWSLRPFGYHLTNLLIHLANAVFIYFILLILTRRRLLSSLTALLFLVHPIQTEAVTYLSGRADILAAFFMLASLLLILISIRERGLKSAATGLEWLMCLASIFFFILALLTKEAAVVLPLLAVLAGVYLRKTTGDENTYPSGKIRFFYVSLFVLAAAYLSIRALLTRAPGETLSSNPYPFYARFLTSFKVIVLYLQTLLIPFPLHMERVIPIERSFISFAVLLPLLFVAGLAIITVRAYRRAPILFLGIAWFFLALLPYLNWFPLNAEMAEHWLYLPSVGFFLLFALLFETILFPKARSAGLQPCLNSRNKVLRYETRAYVAAGRSIWREIFYQPVLSALICTLLCLSALTIDRNRDWRNKETIYTHTARYSPGSPRAHYNLGNIRLQKGETSKAIEEFRLAIKIKPWDFQSHRSLGKALLKSDKLSEAINELEIAVSLRPDGAGPRNELGVAYGLAGMNEKAIRELKIALTLDPESARAHNNLSSVYTNLGKFKEARAECKRALELDPGLAEANFNLGVIYYHLNRPDAARARFEKVLKLQPDFKRAVNWLKRLGARKIEG